MFLILGADVRNQVNTHLLVLIVNAFYERQLFQRLRACARVVISGLGLSSRLLCHSLDNSANHRSLLRTRTSSQRLLHAETRQLQFIYYYC